MTIWNKVNIKSEHNLALQLTLWWEIMPTHQPITHGADQIWYSLLRLIQTCRLEISGILSYGLTMSKLKISGPTIWTCRMLMEVIIETMNLFQSVNTFNIILFFDIHQRINAVGLGDLFLSMGPIAAILWWNQKLKFISYIYTLFLDVLAKKQTKRNKKTKNKTKKQTKQNKKKTTKKKTKQKNKKKQQQQQQQQKTSLSDFSFKWCVYSTKYKHL